MKKIVSISMGLLAILAISCSKKDSPVAKPASSEVPKGETITITVGAPEDIESKVAYAYDEAEKKLKLTWETGDKIVLQQGDQAYPFTATTISENGKMATFTGTSAGEGTYDVFYAGNGEKAMPLAEVEAMDYTAQTQSANDNTQHLKFAARLKSVTFTPGTDDIYFTADWAKEHGNGTYQQSGAIRIRLQNPGVTSLKSVTLTAPSAIFPKTNALSETSTSLTVSLPNASIEATAPIVVYAMLPWSQDGVDLPAGDYTVSVTTEDFDVWTKTKAFEANTLSPVAVNSIGLNKTGFALQDFYGGSGVEGDPYLIANARQMGKINSHLSATKTYYKLVDDIDMTGVTWTSLNADGTNVIDLDGNSKTISHLGKPLFTQINGTVSDLTITDAAISTSGTYYGILCRTINQGTCVISNVSIINSSIESSGGTAGGFIGRVETGCPSLTMTDCSATNLTLKGSGHYAGGLIGYVNVPNVSITRCHTSGTVTTESGSGRHVGGLVGGINENGSVAISDSYSTCTIHGYQFYGGLVGTIVSTGSGSIDRSYATGEVSATKGNAGAGGLVGALETANFSITKSAAWNGKVAPPSGKIGLGNYSSGAVVGRTHPNCVLTDNYRNPAMELTAYWVPSANYDHPNVNGTTAPLVRIGTDLDESNAAPATETSISGDNGRWAYHGKHVAAGTTLSTLASTTLGWSSDVWDFSGALPTLVNNPEN